jgi:beta-lactamase regulating signal transducer with metallopeptidase domain
MTWLADALARDPALAFVAHAVLVASLLAAATHLLLLAARRAPASSRNALALAGVAAVVAAPLLSLAAGRTPFGVSLLAPPAARSAPAATSPPPALPQQLALDAPAQSVAAGAAPAAVPAGPVSTKAGTSRPVAAPALGTWLLAAWLAVAALGLGVEGLRFRRLLRLRRAFTPIDDSRVLSLAATAARELGLRRCPPLLRAGHLPCPVTIGFLRPVIALPQSLLEPAGRPVLGALLRHELAHVALGHPRQALLQLLMRVSFGWHPQVRAIGRVLAASQEEVADNAVLAAGADAHVYARTLVTLAERSHAVRNAPQALFARGAPAFSRRIERLCQEQPETMIRTTRPCRVLATTLAAAAFLLPFTVRLLPAQERAAGASHAAAAFLPLAEGTHWTWRVTWTGDEGQQREHTQRARVWGEVPLDGTRTCTQVLGGRDGASSPSCEYWSADARGVLLYDNAYLGGLRGVNPRDPTRLLPAPVGAETRWEWDDHLSYQTSGNAPQPDPEDTRVHHVGELLAVDEAVTVAAGTFRAAHVRITATNRTWKGPQVRDLWFGRGAGIVREQQTGPGGTQQRELLTFTAGKAEPRDPRARLLAHLRARHGEDCEPDLHWLRPGSWCCYLRGRFAVVRMDEKDPGQCVFVDGAVHEFASDDEDFWAARIADARAPMQDVAGQQEGEVTIVGRGALGEHGLGLTHFAQAMAELEATRRGCRNFKNRGSQSEQALGDDPRESCTVRLGAVDATGAAVQVRGRLDFAGGKVTAAEVEIGPAGAQQEGGRVPVPGLPLPPRRR